MNPLQNVVEAAKKVAALSVVMLILQVFCGITVILYEEVRKKFK